MEVTKDRDPALRRAFARRLHSLRLSYGSKVNNPRMTQVEFARALGIEPERYRRYERGDIEPPFNVMIMMRRLTGVSLDLLIAGLEAGAQDTVPVHGSADGEIVIGQRIYAARSLVEPDILAFAALMDVDGVRWCDWEACIAQPTVEKMVEFAHRVGVSLDYLYRGQLVGIDPQMLTALLRHFPQLRPDYVPSNLRRRADHTSKGS